MNKVIVYNLKRGAGFFSEFFFMVNHFIYCKKNNKRFFLKTNEWLFKHKNGWIDYFININDEKINNGDITQEYYFGNILENYSIEEYKLAIKDIYKYNEKTKDEINKTKEKFKLNKNEYGSIFIRRGDKLIHESKFYSSEIYIKLLLEKCPNCNIIFIQTDDYNCIVDIENYIKTNNLDIKIFTLCEPYMKGIFMDNNNNSSVINKNKNYVNSIKSDIKNYKSLSQMNSNEIYKHTMDMIIGIDILINSKYCILDYQSNVARFIKLAHPNSENVFDIEGLDIDMNKKICPSYPESVYNNPNEWRHN